MRPRVHPEAVPTDGVRPHALVTSSDEEAPVGRARSRPTCVEAPRPTDEDASVERRRLESARNTDENTSIGRTSIAPHSPPTPWKRGSANLRDQLESAHALGRRRRYLLQAPAFALGTLLLIASVVLSVLLWKTPLQPTAFLFGVLAMPVILLALQSSDRSAVASASLVYSAVGIGGAICAALDARCLLLDRGFQVDGLCHGRFGQPQPCETVVLSAALWLSASLVSAVSAGAVSRFFVFRRPACLLPADSAVWARGRRMLSSRAPSGHVDALWYNLSILSLVLTFVMAVECAATSLSTRSLPSAGRLAVVCVECTVFVLVALFSRSPALRMIAHAHIASNGEQVASAAVLSSLIGSRSPEQATALARSSFRYIRFDLLTLEHMLSNSTDTDSLYALSQPARLGDVDLFISHSWSDDALAKWHELQDWGAEFAHQNSRPARVWFDRACLDQNAMRSERALEEVLAQLPIFLAGSRQLLVVCGPTWHSRLWCQVELFIFAAMHTHEDNGQPNISMRLLGADSAARTAISDGLAAFRVQAALCSNEAHQQLLLSAIADGFGGLDAFNLAMRSLFKEKVEQAQKMLELSVNRRERRNRSRWANSPSEHDPSLNRKIGRLRTKSAGASPATNASWSARFFLAQSTSPAPHKGISRARLVTTTCAPSSRTRAAPGGSSRDSDGSAGGSSSLRLPLPDLREARHTSSPRFPAFLLTHGGLKSSTLARGREPPTVPQQDGTLAADGSSDGAVHGEALLCDVDSGSSVHAGVCRARSGAFGGAPGSRGLRRMRSTTTPIPAACSGALLDEVIALSEGPPRHSCSAADMRPPEISALPRRVSPLVGRRVSPLSVRRAVVAPALEPLEDEPTPRSVGSGGPLEVVELEEPPLFEEISRAPSRKYQPSSSMGALLEVV